MKRGVNTIISTLLIVAILFGSILVPQNTNQVNAAATTSAQEKKTSYITVQNFIKRLVIALNISVDKSKSRPYIMAAFDSGILQQGDVSTFDGYITRTECAVLLYRADKYLNGKALEEAYIQKIIEKRISDIKKIDKDKREAVASIYGKGIIKGYSNGVGVQSREFRGDNYLTTNTAKNFINLTINSKKRAKLSPDGQLIRTTNLPKNAKKFDYILECFPNAFYEKKFNYQFILSSTAPVLEGDSYDFPINMRSRIMRNSNKEFDLGEQMDLYLYDWADYVEQFANLIFNVSYKTIDDDWVNSVKSVISCTSKTDKFISNYVENMKYYKVKVVSRKISVEPSTLYYSDGYFMRVYVEYKITANEYTDDIRDYIFSQGGTLTDLKLGKWMTGYLDFEISTNDGQYGDGSSMRAYRTWFIQE